MKHLLIIILSILLLSSPVIGDNHKGETLYLWETPSGDVWKEFGDKETQPKYQGDVKNSGNTHGNGRRKGSTGNQIHHKDYRNVKTRFLYGL